MEDQQKVWNNIAEEWSEFKTEPIYHVVDFLKKQKGNVLDLGSGAGRHLMKIKNGKMYLVDFSEKMIELAKEKAKKENIDAEFAVSDLTKLPYEDNFFDGAICSSTLQCVEGEKNREKVVKELFRVLKPGAQIEIGVWDIKSKRFKNAPKEKYVGWRDKGKRYYYLYEEKEVLSLFKKVGFKIKEKIPSYVSIIFVAEKPK